MAKNARKKASEVVCEVYSLPRLAHAATLQQSSVSDAAYSKEGTAVASPECCHGSCPATETFVNKDRRFGTDEDVAKHVHRV